MPRPQESAGPCREKAQPVVPLQARAEAELLQLSSPTEARRQGRPRLAAVREVARLRICRHHSATTRAAGETRQSDFPKSPQPELRAKSCLRFLQPTLQQ